jgi:hypothetical protein
MKVARVVRHDTAGDFVQHDRERFTILWDKDALAFPFRRGERYVWVEKSPGGHHLSRPRLLLFDERERFLGHADSTKIAEEIAARNLAHHMTAVFDGVAVHPLGEALTEVEDVAPGDSVLV